MSFGTVVNCMDGRAQIPVLTYLRKRFDVPYVDSITEAGPVGVLAQGLDSERARSILRRVDVSLQAHGSRALALVAHADCAGNPVTEVQQREQLQEGLAALRGQLPGIEIIGLWVDEDFSVSEV